MENVLMKPDVVKFIPADGWLGEKWHNSLQFFAHTVSWDLKNEQVMVHILP